MSNQKATDRLTALLTDLFDDSLGFNVKDDEDFRSMLLDVLEAAIELGTDLLCHPVQLRFDWDWVTGDTESEKPIVEFPRIVTATDDEGFPDLRPLLMRAGEVARLD